MRTEPSSARRWIRRLARVLLLAGAFAVGLGAAAVVGAILALWPGSAADTQVEAAGR